MASSTLNIPQADKLSRDTLISKTITALRWPLAFLVVLDHYFRLYLVEDSLGYNLENPQLISGIEAFIISFLKNYPVPVFFFISGYLLYLGNLSLRNNYRAKLKKFPREIIFPYIFWTMYAIAVAFIIGLSRGMESQSLLHIPEGGKFLPGPIKWLITTFIGTTWPANLPLWYVRDLALIIIISPIIHWSLKLSKGWLLLLMGFVFLVYNNDNIAIRFSTGIFFFSLGYWFRYNQTDVLNLARKLFIPALIVYICGATFYFIKYDITIDDTIGMPWINCFMKNVAVISFLPVVFHIISCFVAKGWMKVDYKLAAASFFVYVTHYPIHHVVVDMSLRIFGGESEALVALASASLFTPLVLTLIYYGLKGLLPSFMKVIDGR